MNIYDKVSDILGTYITKDNFDKELSVLNKSGRITQKTMIDLIVLLIKAYDEKS